MNRILLTAVLVSVGCFSLVAQNYIDKGYVLFKGYPYYVSFDAEGNITEFINTAPEIMKRTDFLGDELSTVAIGPNIRPVDAPLAIYNSPLNENDGKKANISSGITMDEVENEFVEEEEKEVKFKPTDNAPVMKTTVVKTEPKKTADPVVINKKAEKSVIEPGSYSLKFQGFTSRLTPALIDILSDISKEYKRNTDLSLTISSFQTAGEETNKKLAENRMKACRDLLFTYGVPLEAMKTSIEPYQSDIQGNVNIVLK